MEDIKKTLAHWNTKKEDFDPKLVAREETGCCESEYAIEGGDNMAGMEGGPCSE